MFPESLTRQGFVSLQKLGQGAFGSVYQVKDSQNRTVALKFSGSVTVREEAQVLQAIGPHPNIIKLYDHGRTTDGLWWYSMEVHSGDLEYWSQRQHPQLTAKLVIRHILQGFIHMNERGYLHCDSHSGNFGVVWDAEDRPRVVVIDFGIATRFKDPQTGELLDRVGGSPYDDMYQVFSSLKGLNLLGWMDQPEIPWREYLRRATHENSVQVVDWLLGYAQTEGYVRVVIEETLSLARRHLGVFRLLLAWTAKLFQSTVAKAARDEFESVARTEDFANFTPETLEYLLRTCGAWDNEDFPPCISHRGMTDIERRVYSSSSARVPPQIDRLMVSDVFVLMPSKPVPLEFENDEGIDIRYLRLDLKEQALVDGSGQEVVSARMPYIRRYRTKRALVILPPLPSSEQCLGDLRPVHVCSSREPRVVLSKKTGQVTVDDQPIQERVCFLSNMDACVLLIQ